MADEPEYEYDYDSEFERHPMAEEVGRLTKQATQARKAGDYDQAIQLAEEALRLAEGEGISPFWQMRPHMKLASYLVDAQRYDEAWRLCETWLSQKRSDRDRAKVYDRMRQVLQKQERHEEALIYSISALLANLKSDRRDEGRFTVLTSDPALARHLKPLLKRADRAEFLTQVIRLVQRLAGEETDGTPAEVESALESIPGYTAPK